jgi:hypothetical protein
MTFDGEEEDAWHRTDRGTCAARAARAIRCEAKRRDGTASGHEKIMIISIDDVPDVLRR